MALTIRFYNEAGSSYTAMTCKSATINDDGSCMFTADAPYDGSQIMRYPATESKIEIIYT